MVVNACIPTTGEVETKKVKFKVLFWSPRKFRGQPTFNPFKTNKTVSVLPTRRSVYKWKSDHVTPMIKKKNT